MAAVRREQPTTVRLPAMAERRQLSSARPRRWAEVRQLLAPHRMRVALLAGLSFLGGIVEAAFLVVITRTALAIADGRDALGVLAGRTASLPWTLLIAVALLLIRLALALAAVSVSSRLVTDVLSDVRSQLADAYLRTSWSVQHAEPPARLQELLASFATTASDVVTYLSMSIIATLNLAALLIVSLTINPIATLVVVAVLGVLGSILAPIRNRIRARATALKGVQLQFSTEVSELGSLSMEMQTTGVRDRFADRLKDLIGQNGVARRRVLSLRQSLAPIYTFLAFGAIVGGARSVVGVEYR